MEVKTKMTKSKHNQVAEKIARKLGSEYKSDKGIDVVTTRQAVEIEVKKSTLNQGLNQVLRSDKARYLAVTPDIVQEALKIAQGSGVGVMSSSGRIVKRAGRKRKV